MSYRAIPANMLIGWGRSLGNAVGCEMAVDLNDHSIKTEMVQPDKTTRAWDSGLYKRGNVFVEPYANPIKPRVNHNDELENKDTLYHVEGEPDEPQSETETDDDDQHSQLYMIASQRYQDFMRQDLISQLLTPQEQWKLVMYAILGNVALTFFAIIVTLYATGSFA